MIPLKKQLANIKKQHSSGNVKLANGKDMKQIMKEEGQRLYDLIKEEIDNYYNSYSPSIYIRSYRLKEALRVDTVQQEGNKLTIRVYFDSGLSVHSSIFNDDDVGDAAILINYGWKVKSDKVPDYPRLKYYEGDGFLNRAINRFNSINLYGLKVHVHSEWDGQIVEDYER